MCFRVCMCHATSSDPHLHLLIFFFTRIALSLFCAVIMTCIWALGTTFHSAKIVAIGAWIATIFYFYATIKDYGDGSKYRENNFQYQGLPQEDQPPSMRVRKTVGLTRATKNPLF